MRKRIFQIAFFALLLFAGIIALTQEVDESAALAAEEEEGENVEINGEEYLSELEQEKELPLWVKPARWFRSNAGGMALEEVNSQFAALHNKYALLIDYSAEEQLPVHLLKFYDPEFYIEVRTLFEDGKESRTQWIFRDINRTTRVLAVFVDADIEKPELKKGFVEIYDEDSFLTAEYNFSGEEQDSKLEYIYKNKIIINVDSYFWEEKDDGGSYVKSHTDFFRYNRSASLRNVERFFYKDKKLSLSGDSIRVVFHNNARDAANSDFLMSEKFNQYPEFFGDLFVKKNDRLVFSTDARGKILNQTLYRKQLSSETGEEEELAVWDIKNTWSGERIVSITKTEGDIVLLANYEYNSSGDRILERNLKNGVLERLVRTEGNKDIEQLYLNNVVVLQAVYEDGRKISETRVKGN